RGIFCEPFWRQTFRAEPKGGFSCHRHRRSHEQMRHVRHARDAVTKRKARAGMPHEELERRECEVVSHSKHGKWENEKVGEWASHFPTFSLSHLQSRGFADDSFA